MSRSTGVGRHPPSQRTHGHSFVNGKASPEYNAWKSMKERCLNPKTKNFNIYGGRGIRVCSEWIDSFETFLADMGTRPSPKHSIDRRDNNGNYEPGNCRWATRHEQCRNKSTNHFVTYKGQRVIITDLPQLVGLSLATVKRRLRSGTPIDGVLP